MESFPAAAGKLHDPFLAERVEHAFQTAEQARFVIDKKYSLHNSALREMDRNARLASDSPTFEGTLYWELAGAQPGSFASFSVTAPYFFATSRILAALPNSTKVRLSVR